MIRYGHCRRGIAAEQKQMTPLTSPWKFLEPHFAKGVTAFAAGDHGQTAAHSQGESSETRAQRWAGHTTQTSISNVSSGTVIPISRAPSIHVSIASRMFST